MNPPEATLGLKSAVSEHRKRLALLVLIKSSYFIAQITCFWLFASMMHQFIVEQTGYAVKQFPLFSIASFCWVVLRYIAQSSELSLNHEIKHELQRRVHKKLSERQHALAQQYSSFQWQQVLLQHIPALADYISQYSVQKYLSAIVPLLALIIVLPVNWLVTLILLCTLPLVPIFMILVGHKAATLHRQHFISLERLGGLFNDRLKALTLITSFNQHRNQSQLLNTASRLVNQQTMKVVSVAFLSTSVLDFFSTVSIALVAVFIGFSLLGELTFGPEIVLQQGLFLLLLAPLLFSELKQLGRLYHQKAQAEAAWENLEPIIESPKIIRTHQPFNGIDWLNFKIETPRLTARSIHLAPGERVHLRGNSGAGKSVLLQALMGLIPASHQLNSCSTLMGQTPIVLPGSVRENLSLGENFSDIQLMNALEQVELKQVICRLPQGLKTPLGEYPPLSGGELQRLMLARVLLRSTDVIMLDEPTAHLPESQHQQLSALINRATQGKTLIWASHKSLPAEWFNHTWQVDNGILSTGVDKRGTANKGSLADA